MAQKKPATARREIVRRKTDAERREEMIKVLATTEERRPGRPRQIPKG
jgi:hypothetical protein